MRIYGLPFSCILLFLAAVIVLACGSPVSHIAPNCSTTATGTNPSGLLQSVTLCPAAADAQNFPDGEVHFIATGYYSTLPSPVTPLTATWGACYQDNPTNGISVSKNGLAQCAAGSVGTYTVWANAPSGQTVCPAFGTACGGGGCQVTGTAQLTCP
jgi:hypothetical protein